LGQFGRVFTCSTDSELRYLFCISADNPRNIVQHSDNAPYTFALSHLPCSATVFFCHETNCSLTKLHVTPVSYRDSRTDSIHRFIPVRGISLKTTAGPTAITNWIFRGSLTSGNTAVASVCVCVCVCVCVQKGSTGRGRLSFCIYLYNAVYRLCTISWKSFILSYISLEKEIEIFGSG